MSSTTLYLKYRPQLLEDLDSVSVRESLKKIVSSGKIPHAFLFAGPKGTGKTSAARIIAKIINCESLSKKSTGIEPCGKCGQCVSTSTDSNIDVIELDAASHRGIDDVRALRDAVKLSPARAKNKVYIIDEAHMLTLEAANALLKTLEEPPSHVYFILATTNPEKLIDTIRSRTTFISFKKATNEEIVRSLSRVAKGEGLKIETATLALIAKAASGSFRDGVKVLEQMVAEGRKFAPDEVKEYLFQEKSFEVEDFLKNLIMRNAKEAIGEVQRGISDGVSVSNILEAVLTRLREGILAIVANEGREISGLSKEELISLTKLFTNAAREILACPIEELPIEIAIVEWCGSGERRGEEVVSEKIIIATSQQDISEVKSQKIEEAARKEASVKEVSQEVWVKILATVKPVNTSIEALLRAAKPISFDGRTLTLGVFYKFHKERLEDVHHRRVLEEVVGSVLGTQVRVVCLLTEPPVKKVEEAPPATDVVLTEGEDEDIIRVAKEIFGN